MKNIGKTLFAILGTTIVLVGFLSCEDNSVLTINNEHHSACLLHTDADAKGFENPDSVNMEYNNGTVHVTHHNLLVNCGTAEIVGGINVTCTRNGSTIDIYEVEDENNPRDRCMCEVDNEFDISGLESGTYTFVFHSWYPEAQALTFTF